MHTVPSLLPVNPPLGPQTPNPKIYSPQQVTLALREKVFSITGDDFTIKTADGVPICKCKGKVFSVHDRKEFTDMQGHELFTLANKMLAIQKSFHGESRDSASDFEIKGHFKLMGSKSTVHFRNASDGKVVELDVKGDWIERKAEIKWEGREIAAISRSFFNAREFFGDAQTYFVTVAPNVDLSLISAICIALDEREHEK